MTAAVLRSNCLLCGQAFTATARTYATGPDLLYAECAACGVAVRRKPADVRDLYDDTYADDITAGFRSEGACRHARDTLRRLARLRAHPGRLLDVGCAGGDFLLAAREAGWRVHGVEMQARSAQRARSRGLTVDGPDLADVPAGLEFDVITLLDVFEHLVAPQAFLARAVALLAADGILYIETPNYGSVFRRLLGRRWMALLPHHECLYSPAALCRVLAQGGFRVVQRTSCACSLLSYDGLRRLRLHRPFYNAGVLVQAAARRVGLGGIVRAVTGVGGCLARVLNWPLERFVGQSALAGDQLIVMAQRADGAPPARGRP